MFSKFIHKKLFYHSGILKLINNAVITSLQRKFLNSNTLILIHLTIFSFFLLFAGCNKTDEHNTSTSQNSNSANNQKNEEYYTCPMHPQIVKDHPGTCPICGMDLVKKFKTVSSNEPNKMENQKTDEYFICPMHPQIVRDHLTTCPICGMDLVKKIDKHDKNTSASNDFEVNLSLDQVALLKVGTSLVEEGYLTKEISAFGILEYRETDQSVISARVKGRIEKLILNSTGMMIKRGQPIFELYSPDIITTEQEYLNLFNSNQNPENSLEVIKQRLLLWGITKEQINELERNKKVPNTITIYSPYSGIVTKKSVVEGQYISEGMDLFNLSGIDVLWLRARIFDYELPYIKLGQYMDITSESYPDKVFQAKINFIYPELDQSSRTIQIRSEIPNRGLILKPGMYVKAKIKIQIGKGLAVPVTSVFYDGENYLVWIQKEIGKYIPVQIKIGPKVNLLNNSESFYQVLEGLNKNDIVVSSSGFLIDSESRIKAAAKIN